MAIERKTYALDQSPFFKLRNRAKLAKLLGVTPAELRRLAKHSDRLYRERDVLKKDGSGLRHIENPAAPLKRVQSTLYKKLSKIKPADYLFCPVKGRDYVANAAQHRGNRIVHCLDVRKYFPSTSAKRVFWFYHKVLRCERDIAGVLTKLSCFVGHLPTGSPLSPLLAYYAHIDVWESIASICKRHGYKLTVYMDDVTISGNDVRAAVVWEIKKEIHRSGLRYHKEKVFVDSPAEVTGVFVKGTELMPPHRQFKKARIVKEAVETSTSRAESEKLWAKLVGLRGQLAQIAKAM